MKITQQFFEEFLDGSDDILELGMRVLKLEILFRANGEVIPISTLFKVFTKEDIEYFIASDLLGIVKNYAFSYECPYVKGIIIAKGVNLDVAKLKKPVLKPNTGTW